jgi:hypothetical protein
MKNLSRRFFPPVITSLLLAALSVPWLRAVESPQPPVIDPGPPGGAMAGPNVRLKNLDPESDAFDRAFERQLETAARCQDTSKKLDK